MGLLAGTNYDPAVAVNAVTTSRTIMTALDTTNLRHTFTMPSNGAVLVRLRGVVHGATTSPQIFLGVMEGATVRGRVPPIGGLKDFGFNATDQLVREALFVVPGQTAGSSVTWDAAMSVDVLAASTGMKYGGPDNTTTNDAFGGFAYEIWETPNLLGAVLYDPVGLVSKASTSLLAMTALDTTNLRITFTVPPSGKVFVRLRSVLSGSSTVAVNLLGILESTTVKFRQAAIGAFNDTPAVAGRTSQEASGVVTGLTPGASLTWDAAWGVEIVGAAACSLRWGGPDNTTTDDAAGAFQFEIWAV